jgi:hypothetical protein
MAEDLQTGILALRRAKFVRSIEYAQPTRKARAGRFFDNAVEQMKQIPGVKSAAAAMGVPSGQYGSNGAYVIDGQNFQQNPENLPEATFSLSGPGYFPPWTSP